MNIPPMLLVMISRRDGACEPTPSPTIIAETSVQVGMLYVLGAACMGGTSLTILKFIQRHLLIGHNSLPNTLKKGIVDFNLT